MWTTETIMAFCQAFLPNSESNILVEPFSCTINQGDSFGDFGNTDVYYFAEFISASGGCTFSVTNGSNSISVLTNESQPFSTTDCLPFNFVMADTGYVSFIGKKVTIL